MGTFPFFIIIDDFIVVDKSDSCPNAAFLHNNIIVYANVFLLSTLVVFLKLPQLILIFNFFSPTN